MQNDFKEELETLTSLYTTDELTVDPTNAFHITYHKQLDPKTFIDVEFCINNENIDILITNALHSPKLIPNETLLEIQSLLHTQYQNNIHSMPIFQCIAFINDDLLTDNDLDLPNILKSIPPTNPSYIKQQIKEQELMSFANQININKKINKPPPSSSSSSAAKPISDFEKYWSEMSAYHKAFAQNKKTIIKRNQFRNQSPNNPKKKGHRAKINAMKAEMSQTDSFEINKNVRNLLFNNQHLWSAIPSVASVRAWLEAKYRATDFHIKFVATYSTIRRFVDSKNESKCYRVVYHGTNSANDDSICRRGLIVGGTKGVGVANGRAHGTGVYCTPSLSVADCYKKGSMYVCLVRDSETVHKAGDIYVVPKEEDILPIYLSKFRCVGQVMQRISVNNQIIKFENNFNGNVKMQKNRKTQRKWSAFHKLNDL